MPSLRQRKSAAKYSRLPDDDVDGDHHIDGFTDDQFRAPPPKIPWKTILFSIFFLFAGSACLVLAFLIGLNYLDEKYADRMWPLFILGVLMLIPGGFYGFTLLCICFKVEGYSWDNIPNC